MALLFEANNFFFLSF